MNRTLLQVFNNTLRLQVRYVFLPGEGAVSTGMGVVSLSPTRTVPVRNPIHLADLGLSYTQTSPPPKLPTTIGNKPIPDIFMS
jgi:hypothetical protein